MKAPKKKKALKRKPSERKVCAFRVTDAEAAAIQGLIDEINTMAQARGIAPYLKADVLRAAVLDWTMRGKLERHAQAVAAHLGEKW